MRHDEFPLFEIHKGKASIKLYPSGIEVDNTIGNSSYFRLSHTEMQVLAKEMSEYATKTFVGRAIAEMKETKTAELKGLHPLFDMLDVDTLSNIYYGRLDAFIYHDTKKVITEVVNEQISIIKEREVGDALAVLEQA